MRVKRRKQLTEEQERALELGQLFMEERISADEEDELRVLSSEGQDGRSEALVEEARRRAE